MPLVVQFISPTPGAGASFVASGYARVAADDCSQPVLYIDCNPSVPVRSRRGAAESPKPTLFDALRKGNLGRVLTGQPGVGTLVR